MSGAAYSQALLMAAPALPVIVHPDGRVEADERLAGLIGLTAPPARLLDLASGELGLTSADAAALSAAADRTATSGAPFSVPVRAQGSARILVVRGGPAPYPVGAVLLWFFDALSLIHI